MPTNDNPGIHNRGFSRWWLAVGRRQNFWRVHMTPNGECQIIGPDRSHIFDAGVNFLTRASPTWKPLFPVHFLKARSEVEAVSQNSGLEFASFTLYTTWGQNVMGMTNVRVWIVAFYRSLCPEKSISCSYSTLQVPLGKSGRVRLTSAESHRRSDVTSTPGWWWGEVQRYSTRLVARVDGTHRSIQCSWCLYWCHC